MIDTLTHYMLNQDLWSSGHRVTIDYLALTQQILAQQVTTSLVDNIKDTWDSLLETGQLWAFLIGLGVGWWIRSILPS
ncbi:MAG: hypothetical protein HC825_11685 [Oscillatoriales cyanobacterium RM1_1_9]|nr:hypothetical protein [Oscillatoriales cyanobacterium SM2_3_0]NJO47120.1 hypothetical protein [Oscillatoriales cyanobacterium RM2_1_1]NJO72140.1 hypothetical protein [Oscillatoriales cyanobacterium RM1_1_9]